MCPDRQLYLTGKIRVYETRLLGRGEFARFLENKLPDNFLRELKDTPYGDYLQEADLDSATVQYIEDIYRYFRKDMGDEAVMLDAFMLKKKVAGYIENIKDKQREQGEKRIFSISSSDPEIVKKARKNLQGSGNLSDREIEKAFMDAADDAYIKKFSSHKLKKLWEDYIDIKNFLNNLRHIERGFYFKGGYIKPSFWEAVDCRQEIPDKLQARPFMKALAREENPEKYELKLRRWLGGVFKGLRKITFGPEPVCAFLLTLMSEVENLTTVYAGLKMGMAPERIEENLYYSHV